MSSKRILLLCTLLVLVLYVVEVRKESNISTVIPSIETTTNYDEGETVEKYIRTLDVTTLTGVNPVLGGNMYLTAVRVDTLSHTAVIEYEDGHIAGNASISYTFDSVTGGVTVVKVTPESTQ